MIVYHGTADYNLQSFIHQGPKKRFHGHLLNQKNEPAFCTTTDFFEAALFAFRRTPACDRDKVGIVIEFDLDAKAVIDKDYVMTEDKRAIRDEKEVAVFNTSILTLLAYWQFDPTNDGKPWKRKKLLTKCAQAGK